MRADAPLFGALLADAFPGAPPAAGGAAPLREAVVADLLEAGLQARSRHGGARPGRASSQPCVEYCHAASLHCYLAIACSAAGDACAAGPRQVVQ
jgi:hypothetical protein